MAPLEYTVSETGEGTVLRVVGELDMDGVLRLEPTLTELIDRRAVASLVLDLGAVRFIDSTGLGLILQTHEAARRCGCVLEIVEAPAGVQRVFHLAGVQDLLPFRPAGA